MAQDFLGGQPGQGGIVVLLAQVGQDHGAQPGPQDPRQQFAHALVAQVAHPAEDAGLQGGRVAALPEHLHVVVGFQRQQVQVRAVVRHQGGGLAQVGDHRGLEAVPFDAEGHRVRGVVGRGEGQHPHPVPVAAWPARRGIQPFPGDLDAVDGVDRRQGLPGGQEGPVGVPQQDRHGGDVVGMLVGEGHRPAPRPGSQPRLARRSRICLREMPASTRRVRRPSEKAWQFPLEPEARAA